MSPKKDEIAIYNVSFLCVLLFLLLVILLNFIVCNFFMYNFVASLLKNMCSPLYYGICLISSEFLGFKSRKV